MGVLSALLAGSSAMAWFVIIMMLAILFCGPRSEGLQLEDPRRLPRRCRVAPLAGFRAHALPCNGRCRSCRCQARGWFAQGAYFVIFAQEQVQAADECADGFAGMRHVPR